MGLEYKFLKDPLRDAKPSLMRDMKLLMDQLRGGWWIVQSEHLEKAMIHCSFLVVREDGGRVIATGTLVPIHSPHDPRASIIDVVVDKSFRRQGIGSKMIEILLQDARLRGLSKVEIEAEMKDDYVYTFLRSLGFDDIQNRRVHTFRRVAQKAA